jgi:hypothetical protein
MRLNQTEAAVLAYLLERADTERRAWPTVREIERMTGCHERNVRKALKSLAAGGKISSTTALRGAALPDGTTVRASQMLVHTIAPPTRQMLLPGVRACGAVNPVRAVEPTPQLSLFDLMKQA